MIIGLAGFAGSGKDTVAKFLIEDWNYKRYAFADAIKETLYDTDPFIDKELRLKTLVDKYGWDYTKNNYPEVRRLLQDFGLSGRNHFGKLHWAHQVFKQINFDHKAVITDIRFWNEADQTRVYDFAEVWRVHRPGVGPINNHKSELDLIDYEYDAIIINDSDLESLKLKIDQEMTRAILKMPNSDVNAFKSF